MDSIRIRGGRPLEGEIEILGAKNAALPLMAASLLTEETLTLSNIPHLTDITTLAHLLAQHGVEIGMDGSARRGGNAGRVLSLRAGDIRSTTAPYELVCRMRASILVLGPLLARAGCATVSLPGGCAIGSRPVDMHIDGLIRLGAEVVLEDGNIRARTRGRLSGAEIRLPFASVGATENLMMAATLADGETIDPQRRARARGRRPRPLSRRDGRGDRRYRQRRAGDSRQAGAFRHRARRGGRSGSKPAPMRWPRPWSAATSSSPARLRRRCARCSTISPRPVSPSARRRAGSGCRATAGPPPPT